MDFQKHSVFSWVLWGIAYKCFNISLPFLVCSLALIKRTGIIDADKPISTQLRVLTLSEDSPYETLHSFISNAVAPFFKSYIRESGKADR